MFWAACTLYWQGQRVHPSLKGAGNLTNIVVLGIDPCNYWSWTRIPSKHESSARVDYVPALCTHRLSLLPIEWLKNVKELPHISMTSKAWFAKRIFCKVQVSKKVAIDTFTLHAWNGCSCRSPYYSEVSRLFKFVFLYFIPEKPNWVLHWLKTELKNWLKLLQDNDLKARLPARIFLQVLEKQKP